MFSHLGFQRYVGHVHSARLYGHGDYRGKIHALNGTANIYCGAEYKALCGENVRADHDGDAFNVWTASDGKPTCKRCARIIGQKKAPKIASAHNLKAAVDQTLLGLRPGLRLAIREALDKGALPQQIRREWGIGSAKTGQSITACIVDACVAEWESERRARP